MNSSRSEGAADGPDSLDGAGRRQFQWMLLTHEKVLPGARWTIDAHRLDGAEFIRMNSCMPMAR